MNKFADLIKGNLDSVLDEMNEYSWLFVSNPKKDFTRKRKLDFKEMFNILLSMGGNSLKLELMKYFSYDVETASCSAFTQQRKKILPEAFEYLFHKFTSKSINPKRYKNYRLLAVDGSDLPIAHNPNDTKTYFKTSAVSKGYNLLHLNAMYDLCNRVYVDAIIQNRKEWNEHKALIDMVKRSNIKDKTIIIADRGYENYNSLEHISKKGWNYIIRVKDINSNGISSKIKIPKSNLFDITHKILLTRRQTNIIKANPDKYKFMPKSQKFDFLPVGDKGTYQLKFRIVRFPISENSYEVLITNLSKDEFSITELKELYHMRWGIETSFRELKYAIGLTNFHSKKVAYIKQEIFARLTIYNFCEIITTSIIIRKKDTKHRYQVNFTMAISICMYYFRCKNTKYPPPNVEALIQKNILPVRNGRKDNRKLKSKSAVSFIYRVA